LTTPLRDGSGFDESSRRALARFHRRMIVALAREMDEAPDPWVRAAIADWLDEFLRESRSWRQAYPETAPLPRCLGVVPPVRPVPDSEPEGEPPRPPAA
jgi:hypothetical protein